MGQKINPLLFRLGHKLLNNWDFFCYCGKSSVKNDLELNVDIRKLINKECDQAQIAKIVVKVSNVKFVIDIYCRKPGTIIGSGGYGIDKLKNKIDKIVQKHYSPQVVINVIEVKVPDVNASLVAQSIATKLEKRGSFRKAMKKAIQLAMKSNAKGIKITCSGRLSGADIARTEKYMEGTVPLHTLRANVDYALAEAKTLYGIIGVKVWIHTNTAINY